MYFYTLPFHPYDLSRQAVNSINSPSRKQAIYQQKEIRQSFFSKQFFQDADFPLPDHQ